jgi:SanA protein
MRTVRSCLVGLAFIGSILVGFGGFLILLIVLEVQIPSLAFIVSKQSELRQAPFAIVLGATLEKDGRPSGALEDRLQTGLELYRTGKVGKLLVTGDDGGLRTDEVLVMKAFYQKNGVRSEDLLVDGKGYRTIKSCKRAAQMLEVFQTNKAIIVTQRFHLPRAIFLCQKYGLSVQGITADKRVYKDILFGTGRDLLASVKAWFEVPWLKK